MILLLEWESSGSKTHPVIKQVWAGGPKICISKFLKYADFAGLGTTCGPAWLRDLDNSQNIESWCPVGFIYSIQVSFKDEYKLR